MGGEKIGEISTISYGISDAIEQSRNSGILTVTLPCVLSSGELIVKPELLAYSDENKVKQSDLLKKVICFLIGETEAKII